MKEIPRPNKYVEQLIPYQPTASRDAAISDMSGRVLKLDWNESTRPPSRRVLESILAQLSRNHLNLYPDIEARELKQALSNYVGLDVDHILVTNGSDDALQLIVRTFIEPGKKIVVPMPTYSHFLVFAQAAGAHIHEIHYQDPFVADWDKLHEAGKDAKMYYMPSPSNPTGVMYTFPELANLAKTQPQTIFLIDEAYFEFSSKTASNLVDTWPNIIVTRTFSKAFGMAGLRIGYILAHPEVIKLLEKLHNPKSVTTLGQAAALGALQDIEYTQKYVQEVNQAKEFVVEALQDMGLEVRSTPANYIMIRHSHPDELVMALERHQCFVRNRSHLPGLEGWIRVTVGGLPEMTEFIKRLGLALEEIKTLQKANKL